ncbi:hypothetical protein L1887_35742 [Cichorium endivia]|nr:hypothetical protein L1887_35742 [Cichorium endivia]
MKLLDYICFNPDILRETIYSLKKLVAEKESISAQMDVASSGEAARLKAAMETIKGGLTHLKNEHENEKERWEVASQAHTRKLEIAEANCIFVYVLKSKLQKRKGSVNAVSSC